MGRKSKRAVTEDSDPEDERNPEVFIFKILQKNKWNWNISEYNKNLFLKKLIDNMIKENLITSTKKGIQMEDTFVPYEDIPFFGTGKIQEGGSILKVKNISKEDTKKLLVKFYKIHNPDWEELMENPELVLEPSEIKSSGSRELLIYLVTKNFDWEIPEDQKIRDALAKRIAREMIKVGLLKVDETDGTLVPGNNYRKFMENE